MVFHKMGHTKIPDLINLILSMIGHNSLFQQLILIGMDNQLKNILNLLQGFQYKEIIRVVVKRLPK
jgi:hypothetical protein